jgi:hypothetical protein
MAITQVTLSIDSSTITAQKTDVAVMRSRELIRPVFDWSTISFVGI